jgi:peptidylprolyl isomerase
MGDAIDLSGDGGVIKTIVRKSKSDAVAPTEDFPVVDGMLASNMNTFEFRIIVTNYYNFVISIKK